MDEYEFILRIRAIDDQIRSVEDNLRYLRRVRQDMLQCSPHSLSVRFPPYGSDPIPPGIDLDPRSSLMDTIKSLATMPIVHGAMKVNVVPPGNPPEHVAPLVRSGPPIAAMEPTSADDEFTGTMFPQIAARPRKTRSIMEGSRRRPMPAPGSFDPRGHLSPRDLSTREYEDLCRTLGYDPATGRDLTVPDDSSDTP